MNKKKENIISLIDELLNDITIGETTENIVLKIKEIKKELIN